MPTYRYIALDAYPLGNAVIPLAKPGVTPTDSEACREWMEDCQAVGVIFLVPAIAYYEVARELERRQAGARISRFESFCFHPSRFVPLATEHLKAATKLWGEMRRSGLATAHEHALDGDIIFAAQVTSLGLDSADCVVATRNVKHMARLGLHADEWQNIPP